MNPEKRQSYKEGTVSFLKEVAIAALAVGIVLGGLYAYSGVWPPMVVVESGSMQHSDTESKIGVIDTGDMVFVRDVKSHERVVTYVDGRENNLNNYGDAGNVIVYRPYGDTTKVPIIHRAVAWVEVNDSRVQELPGGAIDYDNYTFDVPILGLVGMGIYNFTIPSYGYTEMDFTIYLLPILRYHQWAGTVPHDGYVTAGDHNVAKHQGYDQLQPSICSDLIAEDWVIGVAFGEIPWFGLLKLALSGGAGSDVPANSWYMLGATVFVVLAVPFCIDYVVPKARVWWRKRHGNAGGPADQTAKSGGEGDILPDTKDGRTAEGPEGSSGDGQMKEPAKDIPGSGDAGNDAQK